MNRKMSYIRNRGNGQAVCSICASMGIYNLNWTSSTYCIVSSHRDITSKSKCMCWNCLKTIANAFNVELEKVENNEI